MIPQIVWFSEESCAITIQVIFTELHIFCPCKQLKWTLKTYLRLTFLGMMVILKGILHFFGGK